MLENIDVRAMTIDDLEIWSDFAHEISDNIINEIIPDISVFYEGFHTYMKSKIKKQEAYMAFDKFTKDCMGIIGFSKSHNRITFLGISDRADFEFVGSKLMDIAFEMLDCSKAISANVLIGDYKPLQQEKHLYEKYGFIESDHSTFEASVPAYLMKWYPTKHY